jgi:hypothetical protein
MAGWLDRLLALGAIRRVFVDAVLQPEDTVDAINVVGGSVEAGVLQVVSGSAQASTGAPPSVSAAGSAAGTSTRYARQDHTHGHGTGHPGGQHALATTTTPGEMSPEQFDLLENVGTAVDLADAIGEVTGPTLLGRASGTGAPVALDSAGINATLSTAGNLAVDREAAGGSVTIRGSDETTGRDATLSLGFAAGSGYGARINSNGGEGQSSAVVSATENVDLVHGSAFAARVSSLLTSIANALTIRPAPPVSGAGRVLTIGGSAGQTPGTDLAGETKVDLGRAVADNSTAPLRLVFNTGGSDIELIRIYRSIFSRCYFQSAVPIQIVTTQFLAFQADQQLIFSSNIQVEFESATGDWRYFRAGVLRENKRAGAAVASTSSAVTVLATTAVAKRNVVDMEVFVEETATVENHRSVRVRYTHQLVSGSAVVDVDSVSIAPVGKGGSGTTTDLPIGAWTVDTSTTTSRIRFTPPDATARTSYATGTVTL